MRIAFRAFLSNPAQLCGRWCSARLVIIDHPAGCGRRLPPMPSATAQEPAIWAAVREGVARDPAALRWVRWCVADQSLKRGRKPRRNGREIERIRRVLEQQVAGVAAQVGPCTNTLTPAGGTRSALRLEQPNRKTNRPGIAF